MYYHYYKGTLVLKLSNHILFHPEIIIKRSFIYNKQVDILISKNQALQMLFKHRVYKTL